MRIRVQRTKSTSDTEETNDDNNNTSHSLFPLEHPKLRKSMKLFRDDKTIYQSYKPRDHTPNLLSSSLLFYTRWFLTFHILPFNHRADMWKYI